MLTLAFLGNIGFQEMLIILFVGLLLFGSKLPDVGRSLGRSMTEFKKGLRGMQDEMSEIERGVDRRVEEELKRREPEHATRHNAGDTPADGSTPPSSEESAASPTATGETAVADPAGTAATESSAPVGSIARGDASPPPHTSNG